MEKVIWRQSDMQANLSKLYFLRADFSSHLFVTNEVSGKTEITFLKTDFLFPRIHLEPPRQTDVVIVDVVVGVAEEDGVEAEVVVAQRKVFHAAAAVEEVVAGGKGGVV